MLGMHTVGHLFWGKSTLFHDVPLLLGLSIQSSQLVVANVTVVWGICGLVLVSRMHTVFICLAAVIDRVMRCCGAAILSVWAGRVTDGGACGLVIVLSFCWWGGAVTSVLCPLVCSYRGC